MNFSGGQRGRIIFFAAAIWLRPVSGGSQTNDDFGAYAGSVSCRECHARAYQLWAGSHHAEAERQVSTNRDRGAFDPAREVKSGSAKTVAQWHAGQAFFATQINSNRWETNRVSRVIGEDPLRQFLIAFPGGRLQVQEASYGPHSNEWFDVFGNENRHAGEWGHWTGRGMNWNSMCAACHNTAVRKKYDAPADSYHTTMAEPTVSCEACHGPLKVHVEWQKKYGGTNDPSFPKLSRQQVFDMCGSCHARRSDLTGAFKPGDKFFDHFELSTVDGSDMFYPDGQIHEEDYEFSAFLGSKMHQAGLTCLDCHPRSLHVAKLHGNNLCLQCHQGGFPKAPKIDPVAHSHHPAASAGNECAGCHMPQTVYMQRHWRHDHGFTIPDPLLTQQFGVPNACNRCHADQSADWALKNVDAWYGDKMQRPTRVRAQTIARAKNGDEGAQTNLVRLLQTEEIPYWRAVAAGLLASWAGDKDVAPALLNGLRDTNELVRSACIRSLAPLADSETVSNALAAGLLDASRNVRIAAAMALEAALPETSPAGVELKQFLDCNADQPQGQLQLGIYCFLRGDLAAARQHLQTAVDWDNFSAPLRLELATVLSALGKPADAVAQLQTACRNSPRDAAAHFSLGLALNETGDAEQAKKELATAVQVDPHFARAWYNLGLLQNAGGEPTNAIVSLLQAEKADTADPRAPYARATILARLGRVAEARSALQRVLAIRPEDAAARQLLDMLAPPSQ
jgi:tetratricopeptide (TPR) repeat protein